VFGGGGYDCRCGQEAEGAVNPLIISFSFFFPLISLLIWNRLLL
jgi:hypothetical protein